MVRLSGTASRTIAERILRFSAHCEWQSWRAQLAHLIDADGAADRPGCRRPSLQRHAPTQAKTSSRFLPWSTGGPSVLSGTGGGTWGAPRRAGRVHAARLHSRAYRSATGGSGPRLIDATTLYQASVAAQQMDGSVSRRIRPIKEQLLELIALLEAGIDFAEDDISVAPARRDPAASGTNSEKSRTSGWQLRSWEARVSRGFRWRLRGDRT